MLLTQLPQIRITSYPPCLMYVGHIENIFQSCIGIFRIQQGNSLCSTVYPAIHLLIPYFNGRTGCRIRSLCKNQYLLIERIFIKPCSGSQIPCPLLPVFRYLFCGILRQIGNHLIFCYHKHSSKMTEGIAPAALLIKTVFFDTVFQNCANQLR